MYRFFLLLCACVVATGTACSRRPTVAPSAERFLNFDNGAEPEYLDPGMMSGDIESNLAHALFEGLTEYDPKDLHPVPGVAERWEISPDGRGYTFFLRKNAQWSDGKPVTAHDFVYTWERVLNPKTAAKYAFILFYLKNGKAYNDGTLTDPTQLGFKALDDLTLQVTLEHPTPYFLQLTSYYTYRPVPKWVVEAHGPRWTRPAHMVSNGAFVLKSWVPHKEIVVVKNPTYWDAAHMKLAGIRFLPIDDLETGLKLYEAGQSDYMKEPPTTKLPALMGRPDLVRAPFLATYLYRINVTKPPLNDVRVRRALALAIDRKTLAEKYLQNTKLPWASMVPAGLHGYTPAPGPDFNPTEAKRLLGEAGYTDPTTFPPITILYNTQETHKLIAEVIQQMWRQHLGIQVGMHNEEWKSYLKDMQQLNYQIARYGWIADYPDPNSFLELFLSYSGENMTGWSNPEFDRLLEAAKAEADPSKRLHLLHQAETTFLHDLPAMPIYTYIRWYLLRPTVKGFYPTLQDIHPFKYVSFE